MKRIERMLEQLQKQLPNPLPSLCYTTARTKCDADCLIFEFHRKRLDAAHLANRPLG